VLLNELGEKDEDEWPAAKDLIDLYSCRTCVIHIAQVYVKGIMLSSKDDIFDHRGSIDYDEAQSIITRLFDREQRIPKLKGKEFKVEQLSPDEAKKLILDDNTAIIVDVRSKEEYDTGHIEGSINIPLQKISNNPFMVCVNMNTPIILYCNMRYKSSIAAELLIDVGYSRVYTIPGVEQYDYF
ncbi:MAG: rhodanese-like domain-containing protein, partial [Clostridiales bacterium]|nr:rhodanese-like domain-containing protein [Clostridiales bacterium]